MSHPSLSGTEEKEKEKGGRLKAWIFVLPRLYRRYGNSYPNYTTSAPREAEAYRQLPPVAELHNRDFKGFNSFR